MRLGCFGCLALLVLVLVVAVAALGVIFLSGNITTPPENVQAGRFTRADGYSAQQKLYEVVLRQTGRSSRQDPVVITEQEANAFLSNHLAEEADLSFSPISVRFRDGQVEFRGQTPLRKLLQGPPFAQLLPYISDVRLDTPLWVTVKGRMVVEPAGRSERAHARMDLSEFALGQQNLGTYLLSLMLGPTSSRIFRWQVPTNVQEIQVQEGKLTIVTVTR